MMFNFSPYIISALQAEFQGEGAKARLVITVELNGVDRTMPARLRGIVASLLQSQHV
jgi:hypothetical protein